jgi:hypothetical protein
MFCRNVVEGWRVLDAGGVGQQSATLAASEGLVTDVFLQGRVRVEKLVWGCEHDIERVVDAGLQQQKQLQQRTTSRPPFDLIVGSDLLYNPDAYAGDTTEPLVFKSAFMFDFIVCFAFIIMVTLHPALLFTLQSFAPCPHTLVVLAYPPRLPAESRFVADFRAHFEVSVGQLCMGQVDANGGGLMMVAEGFRLEKNVKA